MNVYRERGRERIDWNRELIWQTTACILWFAVIYLNWVLDLKPTNFLKINK